MSTQVRMRGLFTGCGLALLTSATALSAPSGKAEAEVAKKAVEAAPAKAEAKRPEGKSDEVKAIAPAAMPAPSPAEDEPDVGPVSEAKAQDGGWLDGEDGPAAKPAPEVTRAPAQSEPVPGAPEPSTPKAGSAASTKATLQAPAAPRYIIPPSTEAETEPPPEDYNALPFTYHQLHWDVAAAVRVSLLRGEGYDLFSEDDALTQVSLTVGRAIYNMDRLSVAVAGLFEMGGSEALTRGIVAEYQNQRFGLSLEARYHVWHWLHAYLRVAPSAFRGEARLSPAQGGTYENAAWGAGVDGALGVALRPFGTSDGRKAGARFFVFAEGGYGIAEEQDLSLEAVGPSAPDRAAPLELGGLDTSGVLMRFGAMLTF